MSAGFTPDPSGIVHLAVRVERVAHEGGPSRDGLLRIAQQLRDISRELSRYIPGHHEHQWAYGTTDGAFVCIRCMKRVEHDDPLATQLHEAQEQSK